jgi:Heterokaryon incompatibility protein (HET)
MDAAEFNDTFIYDAPCVGRRIRLLSLLPGSGSDQLAVSLEEAALDSSDISFTALSYVWGPPHDTRMASCNGKAISITLSLYSALWQLREEECRDYIWADAICINQNDMAEKTEQVRMMGGIYKQASLVFIWLGERAEDDLIGMALMKYICDRLEEDNLDYTSGPPDPSFFGITRAPAKAWPAMVAIFQRPWFWRAWVVQEYCYARKRVFRCGNLVIPPDLLFGFIRRTGKHLRLQGLVQLLGGRAIRDPKRLDAYGPFFQFSDVIPGKMPFLAILVRARGLESTDRRDRLFALTGLSSDTSSSFINYKRDFGEILRDIATNLMQSILSSSNPTEVFDYLCMVHKNDLLEGMSSWASAMDLPNSFTSLRFIFKMKSPLKTLPRVSFNNSKVQSIAMLA